MPTEIITELWLKGIAFVFTVLAAITVYVVLPYIRTRIGVDRLQTLALLAKEAYAFVEAQAPELLIHGQAKLDMAVEYLNARLAERRIPVTVDQIRAAIESAWLEQRLDELERKQMEAMLFDEDE
jgi:hypothetical protein